ncbi:hypothetical protein C5167_008169 [Papaver somniferum]|uniref:Uncharacterized protein n=1 Tax=Papaver somniferum TaxID=3469 RepID=A0A4Y7JTS0_PAPSO|nr:hypothetical protein C5167_008169 [Papaver somniferum]
MDLPIKTLTNHMRLFNHLQILYKFNVLVLKEIILLLLHGIIRFILVLCASWKDDGMTVFLEGCDKQVKIWPLTSGGQPVTVVIHDAEP